LPPVCDIAVVARPQGVLFAKNSDRDANEAQLLEWHPRREARRPGRLRCTWTEIDEAPLRHAVLLSRPFWTWGAEMGANEHGLVVGNVAVFTRERVATTGLTGMDLVRLVLERAADAEEGTRVLAALLGAHRQGGGCGHEHRRFTYHSSFVFADARRAFLVETAGRAIAVEEVRGARTISNGLTLPGFAEAHADPLRTRIARARERRAWTTSSVARVGGPVDLFALLRSHGDAPVPRYSFLSGALSAPCAHAAGVLAATQTTASWVSDLTPSRIRHFATGTAAPCTSLFKPVDVSTPLDLGSPTDRYDPASLWWRHERLHRRVLRDPAAMLPLLAAGREIEARWVEAATDPRDAFAEADRELAAWLSAAESRRALDRRPFWVRHYWRTRDRRAGLPAGPT
jgi:secernin